MTVSPSKRAASYILAKEDADRAEEILKEMIQIETKDVPRPPMEYIIHGLHAIVASRLVCYNVSRHPQRQPGTLVPIELQSEPTDAEDDAIAQETISLQRLLKPGTEWHYSGEVLCANLEALRDGYLVFPEFVRQ